MKKPQFLSLIIVLLPVITEAQHASSRQIPSALKPAPQADGGPQADRPRGTAPGYEEAKRLANEGHFEPTTREILRPETPPAPLAPTLGGSFLADTMDARLITPPDLTIAAGRDHLVTATNQGVKIFDKEGNPLPTPGPDLCAFFNQDGSTRCRTGEDPDEIFDPKVIYDEYIERFWVTAVTFNREGGVNPQTSDHLIALSNSGDPTAGWTLFQTSMLVTFNQDGLVNRFLYCDSPGFGIDAQALYISCNMNTFVFGEPPFRYSKLRVMTKQQFIDGREVPLWWDFFDGDLCEDTSCNGRSFAVQPAHMRGARADEGELLINSFPNGGRHLTVRRVTSPERCCIPGEQRAPILEPHVGHLIGHYGMPRDGRQPISWVLIHTGDTRLQYAVWEGGRLSTGNNVACGPLWGACVAFYELDVSRFPTITTLSDVELSGEDGIDRYYPAVDVNASGKKTMVYSSSGDNQFPSAAFIGIPPSRDCTNCFDGPERFLRAGERHYVNVGCPAADRPNWWGRHSGAAADPDGVGIWIYGEFAPDFAFQCGDLGYDVDAWGTHIGITHRALTNPIPSVAGLGEHSAFVSTPGFPLIVNGSDFISGSEVRWNGSLRNTTFVSPTRLRAAILDADLQEEGVARVTVFNPAPGGGTSEPAFFGICAGTIRWLRVNGLWGDPVEWSGAVVPYPDDDVCIGPPGRPLLNAGSHVIKSLRSHGTLTISGNGSLSITDPSVTSFTLGLELVDGTSTLTGDGHLTVELPFVWLGGRLSGRGAFNANRGIALRTGPNAPKILEQRTLNNFGIAFWYDTRVPPREIVLRAGATFNNHSAFVAEVDSDIRQGGDGTFNNLGSFVKSRGTGTTGIQVTFNNTGDVAVRSGTLSLTGGGMSTGSYSVVPGSTVEFGLNHELNGSVSGAGTVRFATGPMNIRGTYDVTGATEVDRATVNFNPGMTLTSLGRLSFIGGGGGTVNFSSGTPITQDTFTLFGGPSTLTGSDSFTVTGLFTWREGTISGSGPGVPFIANGGMTLATGNSYKILRQRTLINTATATWTDTSGWEFLLRAGAIFNNRGIFDVQNDSTIRFDDGTAVAFLNEGTFRKSMGAGTTRIGIPFINTGEVSARTGTLRFTETYRQSAADASTVLDGGALASSLTMNIQEGSLSGFGTLTAPVANSGTVSPGSSVTTGTLNIIGIYNCFATANLNIRIAAPAEFDHLAVTGSASLDGTLNVTLEGGFMPVEGHSFNIMTFGSRTGTFATTNLPPLSPGLDWDLQYSANAVTLNVVAAPGPVLGAR